MEGLGNEVPFFVHTYDIADQVAVYTRLRELVNRLETSGVRPLLISLYDMVIEHFQEAGELEDLFAFEQTVSKEEFRAEMHSYTNPENLLRPYFASRMKGDDFQLIVVYQDGEVFPFMRVTFHINRSESLSLSRSP